ncbi:MAG: phosphoribosylanthranilate isomerase [bacterium]|nr:phosphoribosylanthranilate isomerase [bacterium]
MTDELWVKVCGLTRTEDLNAVIEAGVDAVGLVLVRRSPRCLDLPVAAELADSAKGRATVVVLVEGEPDEALTIARSVGADMVQPYGDHAEAIADVAIEAGLKVLFPIQVTPGDSIGVDAMPAQARPLLDSAVGGVSGGTGIPFDWGRARQVGGAVIAGGLNPENVASAVIQAEPWGVDASSGLEAEVGVKDHGKVSAFIQAAKSPKELQ